jgi:hypothetical protein
MGDLKQKIKNTALFSADEKVEILAAIDTFSQGDLTELTDIVDEYDRAYADITHTFKHNMLDELESIKKNVKSGDRAHMEAAIEKISSGLHGLIPDQTS